MSASVTRPQDPPSTTHDELARQLATLHRLGYPELAGRTGPELDALVAPLRERLEPRPVAPGSIPFVLVVAGRFVPTTEQVGRWSVGGRGGWTDMADELGGFRAIEGVDVPSGPVYLLEDVDTGASTLGVTPDDALPRVLASGRTPLTIDEGVAVVTQFPQVFTEHNAFQALGSRAGNRRVPSFWVSKGAPRLGWCWAGNPHSWLGAASAGRRLGAAAPG